MILDMETTPDTVSFLLSEASNTKGREVGLVFKSLSVRKAAVYFKMKLNSCMDSKSLDLTGNKDTHGVWVCVSEPMLTTLSASSLGSNLFPSVPTVLNNCPLQKPCPITHTHVRLLLPPTTESHPSKLDLDFLSLPVITGGTKQIKTC